MGEVFRKLAGEEPTSFPTKVGDTLLSKSTLLSGSIGTLRRTFRYAAWHPMAILGMSLL